MMVVLSSVLLIKMRIYALLSDVDNPDLEKAIKRDYPGNFYDFKDGQWFIAGNGTAVEIYKKLSREEDIGCDIGSVVVISILNYYGYASTDLWDWIKEMSEKNG